MKKIYNKILVIISISVLFTTACDTSILDVQPKGEFPEESVWEDPNLMTAFLNDIYLGMEHGLYEVMLGSLADESHFIHGYGVNEVVQSNHSASNRGALGNGRFSYLDWGPMYSRIRQVNTFLGNADTATFSSEEKEVSRREQQKTLLEAEEKEYQKQLKQKAEEAAKQAEKEKAEAAAAEAEAEAEKAAAEAETSEDEASDTEEKAAEPEVKVDEAPAEAESGSEPADAAASEEPQASETEEKAAEPEVKEVEAPASDEAPSEKESSSEEATSASVSTALTANDAIEHIKNTQTTL